LRGALIEYVSSEVVTLKTNMLDPLRTLTHTSAPFAWTLRVTAEIAETPDGFDFEGDMEAKLFQ
jgi:hypothetical protein